MICLRIFVLITLRTILNAIVCCLQLNTGRGSDDNLKVDFLGIDACWIAVYVLCRNAQLNLTILIMSCMCIVMPSLFVNCPTVICSPNMLLSYGRDTSSELWTPVHSFTSNTIYCNTCFTVLCKQSSSTLYI